MYLQWGISLGAYHTNRLKQEILCWKYKLVCHLGKIRTHWHTKTAKIRSYWHTKKAEKDTHSCGTSLAFICSKLRPPPPLPRKTGSTVSGTWSSTMMHLTTVVVIKSPRIHLHTPPNPTCSRWYNHDWLKDDYNPDSPSPVVAIWGGYVQSCVTFLNVASSLVTCAPSICFYFPGNAECVVNLI